MAGLELINKANKLIGDLEQAEELGKRARHLYDNWKAGVQQKSKVHAAPSFEDAAIEIGPNKKPKVVKATSAKVTPGSSQLIRKPYGIGAHLTGVVENNWSTPINLRLGSRVTAKEESMKNFLDLISGSGKITTSFGGRLQSDQDKRAVHYAAFRHNLHDTSYTDTQGPYPSTANVMTPGGTLNLSFSGFPTDFSKNITLTDTPISTVSDGALWWSPLNRADYEDMSWNLNRLKVKRNEGTSAAATTAGFAPDVRIDDSSIHRLNSQIYKNNRTNGEDDVVSETRTFEDIPYKYNMVFQQGTLDYSFMNKGETACQVEVIVYRVKKTGNASNYSTFSGFDLDSTLLAPIKQGYVNKLGAYAGTDWLASGRTPVSTDCVTNPAHPFLPQTRYTCRTDIPFAESQRIKVTIPSGTRRPMKIYLGGKKYDPANTTGRHVSLSGAATVVRGIMDEYSYLVAIAVNGIQVTRQVHSAAVQFDATHYVPNPQNIGDMYAPADLQWYLQYTEEIEAASYKKRGTSRINVNGFAPQLDSIIHDYNEELKLPDEEQDVLHTRPVTMIPQSMAVRVPPSQIRVSAGADGIGESTVITEDVTPGAASASGPDTTPGI